MFQNNREAHFQDLLDDPIIRALMKADKVDALKLEAMLLRIADDLKSRNEPLISGCPFAPMFGIKKFLGNSRCWKTP